MILLFALLAGVFADYRLPPSNTLRFRSSCAHAMDDWVTPDTRAYRETQRWFAAFLRDPNPALSPQERLSGAFLDMHDEAVDRLADLAPQDRKVYQHRLAKSGLAEGNVLEFFEAISFLNTLTGVHLHLRAANILDLGAMPGAAVMLATVSGVVSSDNVFIGEYDPADPFADEAAIEPEAYQAFVAVEETLEGLRSPHRARALLAAFVPGYRYRRAALLETIRGLVRQRRMPPRIRQEIKTLRELAIEFDVDEESRSQTFDRMVGVLREIETYGQLYLTKNALGLRQPK